MSSGIDWFGVAQDILSAVGATAVLGGIAFAAKLPKLFRRIMVKVRRCLLLPQRVFRHKRYIRNLARENRKLRAQLGVLIPEYDKLVAKSRKENPQLTDAQLQFMKSVATWNYTVATASDFADEMGCDFDYALGMFAELGDLGLIGNNGRSDPDFWLTDKGRLWLMRHGILTKDGIVK